MHTGVGLGGGGGVTYPGNSQLLQHPPQALVGTHALGLRGKAVLVAGQHTPGPAREGMVVLGRARAHNTADKREKVLISIALCALMLAKKGARASAREYGKAYSQESRE